MAMTMMIASVTARDDGEPVPQEALADELPVGPDRDEVDLVEDPSGAVASRCRPGRRRSPCD